MDYRMRIAQRYLVSPKRVSLISVITGISMTGVALGVAALIVVLSVMNGFFSFVRDMLVSIDPHVRIVSVETGGLANADSVTAVALALPDVQHASAYVEGKALLTHNGSSDMNVVVIVRGVEPEMLAGVSSVVSQTDFGTFRLERQEGRAGIVLGMGLGQRYNLLPGGGGVPASEVGLLSAAALERTFTSLLGAPPVSRFAVRGLYQLNHVYDNTHVFIDLREAQRLFRTQHRVTGIELRLTSLDHADAVQRALQAQLDPARYEVLTWYDLQRSLYDVMRLEKWGASAILILIVVVAAFNIIGSLTMVVIEKRRDVGVLQAMGVSRKNIRRIFLYEGLLIGSLGTGAGLILGLGLAWAQQQFGLVPLANAESFLISSYPVVIEWTDVAAITAVAMGLCLLAALYPAYRAAAIQPAEAVKVDG